MTNPNDAIGTNAAYGGRTSTNAFNDNLAAFSRGVLSGWDCTPNAGLTVSLGGDGYNRDVAIAEDNAGNKTTINNISESPVNVTMAAAPASNTRIDVIVAYVDNPATGNSSEADNPDACGIIPVSGTPSVSPVAPDDGAIRSAITADGASGTNAYYSILAYVTIASGTTDITSGDIASGPSSKIKPSSIIDTIYPIGAYYETSDTLFDPNISWGGTWVEDTDGRILVAKDNGTFATVGDTGGSEKHSHTVDARIRLWIGAAVGETSKTIDIVDENGNRGIMTQNTGIMPTGTTNRNSGLTGGNTSFNHDGFGQKVVGKTYSDSSLQPYIVIKRWHRTA